jgi:hypothetical protein
MGGAAGQRGRSCRRPTNTWSDRPLGDTTRDALSWLILLSLIDNCHSIINEYMSRNLLYVWSYSTVS